MSSYVYNPPYGNLILNILPKLPPIMLWSYFVYQYYYPYIKKQSLQMSLVMFLIIILPIIIAIYPLFVNSSHLISNTPFSPILWPQCFRSLDKQDMEAGAIGIWDYKCARSQIDFLEGNAAELRQKFYYINFFLLQILIIYGRFIKKSARDLTNNQAIFMSIALVFGTIGSLVTSFTQAFYWSLMISIGFSTLLNVNIAAFLLVLVSLKLD